MTAQADVFIVDYGSQYTQLIARRIRELGVYSEVIHPNQLSQLGHRVRGLILSGGPGCVQKDVDDLNLHAIFALPCPILGICFGMQLMAAHFGGQVSSGQHHEYGRTSVLFQRDSALTATVPLQASRDTWMSHRDSVTRIPEDFVSLAQTESGVIAGMAHVSKPWYGLQFHPEVQQTQDGLTLLRHFIFDVCQLPINWTQQHMLTGCQDLIRNQLGSEQVILGLSGGVDSSVVATLLSQVVGDRLTCIFIDNGLLRLEDIAIKQRLQSKLLCRVITVDAQTVFLKALQGVSEPEAKRKIVGELFIKCFQEEAAKLEGIQWLAQGTIYPDVIESGGGHGTDVIKSHHNVGGLPADMPFQLIEPIRHLFKDEVRTLGQALELDAELLHRHPFPGPGLAVRILGEVTAEKVTLLQQVDDVYIRLLKEADCYHQVQQAFSVLLPIQTVGVQGDSRTYGTVVVLRAVITQDFMTAQSAALPHDLLTHIASSISNHCPEVTRVVYDVSGKPPATIEWE